MSNDTILSLKHFLTDNKTLNFSLPKKELLEEPFYKILEASLWQHILKKITHFKFFLKCVKFGTKVVKR